MSSPTCDSDYKYVATAEVESFVERCMIAVGTDPQHSNALAQVLREADYRGHVSHGLNRLEIYVRDIKNGTMQGQGEPSIEKETGSTALVNGNNLLGPVVGNFSMDLAIKKAKEHGIGWVVCKGSNHFGIAGWYSSRALQHGIIGMCMTNTSPVVVPTRAAQPSIGTNPLAVAAPAKAGDSFQLDMATSATAFGKVEMCRRKEIEMPLGWGVNSTGKVTVNPQDVTHGGGGLLPLGGQEITGGHKGYGLAMMVDVFCGILSGSSFGPTMRKWQGDNERVADLVRYTQLKDLNPELHDAVAVLYHLSHQDNLELVVMCVHDNPPEDGYHSEELIELKRCVWFSRAIPRPKKLA